MQTYFGHVDRWKGCAVIRVIMWLLRDDEKAQVPRAALHICYDCFRPDRSTILEAWHPALPLLVRNGVQNLLCIKPSQS